uniref:Uncharacterized protein n=1 Tax=Brassica oleracea TaxID=3712 RepID=A0A3P6BLU4_BRAOL|nr:unnamed protein product [Brassica oleracea]
MRLYPPIRFESKTSIKSDVLPSGHRIDANPNIIFLIYALGRMRSLWGEDALEFNPERWISESGGYDFNEDYNRGDITTIVETSTAAAATPSTPPPISPCMPPPPTPCTTTATIPFTTTSISAHSSPAITIVASYTTIFHQIH